MFQTTIPAPKIFAAPGNAASDDEVSLVVEKVVRNSVNADDRRERLYQAVFAAVSGKTTIKDACTLHVLPASTVHPYVSRARHMLGERCPQPKIATISSPAANFQKSTQAQVCRDMGHYVGAGRYKEFRSFPISYQELRKRLS